MKRRIAHHMNAAVRSALFTATAIASPVVNATDPKATVWKLSQPAQYGMR